MNIQKKYISIQKKNYMIIRRFNEDFGSPVDSIKDSIEDFVKLYENDGYDVHLKFYNNEYTITIGFGNTQPSYEYNMYYPILTNMLSTVNRMRARMRNFKAETRYNVSGISLEIIVKIWAGSPL